MNIIETHDLTKTYGKRLAVDKLNLAVPSGSVFGLVGPNGAGKTSTLRMLATLLEPTSGDAAIAGASIKNEVMRVRRAIGYMPDFFGVYDDMKVWEYLDFFAADDDDAAAVAADAQRLLAGNRRFSRRRDDYAVHAHAVR